MKNKLTIGIMALATIALLGAGLVAAFPMMNGNWDVSQEEREEHQAFMEQVREAIENEDFDAWEELMLSQITLENFNEHVERHQEMEELREQREQCIEDPENCQLEGWEDEPWQNNWEERNWGEIQQQCSENSEDCPYGNRGQMQKDFNQDQRHRKWAFWKGFNFGRNRA